MDIVVGNDVKFLNEELSGKVKTILSDGKLIIEANDGFDYEVFVNEIIVINDDNSHVYQTSDDNILDKIEYSENLHERSKSILDKYLKTKKFQYERVVEIDLHLEKLVDFPQRLDDWQKLHTQMQYAKNCLNAAFEKKITKIVFIHGVGTGVLKTEICNYLSGYSNLTFTDADSREYGMGATEVIVKND